MIANMNNQFINRENCTSFLLNFLAVVLGIVITFGGESLISHKEEKRNLNNCLELVAIELQNNAEYLHGCDSLMQKEIEAASFLIRHERDYYTAPEDSLRMYCNVPLTLGEAAISGDAFELLKSSGVLTKIRDKKVALDIFSTYNELQEAADFLNLFYEHKVKYLEPAMNDKVKNLLAGDNVTAAGLWSELSASDEGRQFIREIIRFLAVYDPSGLYADVDGTIDEIAEYIR